jgi:L-serine dehydratase
MSKKEHEMPDDKLSAIERSGEAEREDPLGPLDQLISREIPPGVDRRTFLMRSAVVGATAVITGSHLSGQERTKKATGTPPKLDPNLDVVKKQNGPVMTTVGEFYKVGPGPSSSHTIGPMRITYDFYQRCTKLPADQLAQATALKVHLYGSLSATGKGHGTERAALAGLVGKEPATVDPAFLDNLRDKPDQSFTVKLSAKTLTVYKRALEETIQSDRGIGALSAYALAGSEENGRGHLVVTAPTGGSAGVMPALV